MGVGVHMFSQKGLRIFFICFLFWSQFYLSTSSLTRNTNTTLSSVNGSSGNSSYSCFDRTIAFSHLKNLSNGEKLKYFIVYPSKVNKNGKEESQNLINIFESRVQINLLQKVEYECSLNNKESVSYLSVKVNDALFGTLHQIDISSEPHLIDISKYNDCIDEIENNSVSPIEWFLSIVDDPKYWDKPSKWIRKSIIQGNKDFDTLNRAHMVTSTHKMRNQGSTYNLDNNSFLSRKHYDREFGLLEKIF